MCIEFLFFECGSMFSEDEQYIIYLVMVKVFDGCLLIVCVFDIGGDKQVVYLELLCEENLFFGVCGVCLLLCCFDLLDL